MDRIPWATANHEPLATIGDTGPAADTSGAVHGHHHERVGLWIFDWFEGITLTVNHTNRRASASRAPGINNGDFAILSWFSGRGIEMHSIRLECTSFASQILPGNTPAPYPR